MLGVTSFARPTISITTHLWLTWLRIGVERAKEARRVRDEIGRQADSARVSALLTEEFEASLVAVTASAAALDALFGSLAIPPEVRRQKVSTRPGKIREALKQVFETGPVNTPWVAEFDWLYNLRDPASHWEEEPKDPEWHPIGTNTAPEQVAYSVENAERAVSFALSVFKWCVEHPRRSIPSSVSWAEAMRPAVEELQERWRPAGSSD